MKVYMVKPDLNYRVMYPEDSVFTSEHWEFKCKPLIDKLTQGFKAQFSKKSEKPIPDIAYIGTLTFAFRDDVATELADILEDAGELIPFYVDGQLWYCFNVLKSVDAVDADKSTYEVNTGDVRFGLKDIVFKADMLKDVSIFKIPTDNFTKIYCTDLRDTDEHVLNNLFCAIAAHNYTGIDFVEVYSDEA